MIEIQRRRLSVIAKRLVLLHERRANRDGLLAFRMKMAKSVVLSRSDFPGFSGEIVEENLLRGVGKLI